MKILQHIHCQCSDISFTIQCTLPSLKVDQQWLKCMYSSVTIGLFFPLLSFSGKRSWVMNAGQMSPLAGGRHGSPVLSPTNSLDRPSASLQRMYSMDLPTLSVGPTVVQHTPGRQMMA